jgi:RNA polymerase sigma factor (sigma-70 family)
MSERVSFAPASENLDAQLAAERQRLVGLCARLSGDATVAEDLAQETLAEGWRLLAKLHQPEGLASWLNAVARNICLRWARERGRNLAHIVPTTASEDGEEDELDRLPAEDGGLDIALERGELIELLDHALALLPYKTRAALIGTYVRELPQAELAPQLGLSEGALRLRLHRGRLALRHALASDLRDEAVALGITLPGEPEEEGWRATRIWCPFCGRYPLEYRLESEHDSYTYRCVGCCHAGGMIAGYTPRAELTGLSLSSPKPRLTRHCLALDHHYRNILATDPGRCVSCGAALDVYRNTPERTVSSLLPEYSIELRCPICGSQDGASAWHLALDTPEAQRFWRRHPRMRALPVHAVETEGAHALWTGFESADGGARLVVISDRWTYRVLSVQGEGEEA